MRNISKTMARLELIKELRLRRKEIYSQLQDQFPELMDELEAIDKIIGNSKERYVKESASTSSTGKVGTPKGDMTWEEYVFFMLKEIGGVGKSSDVAKAIVNANDTVTHKRAKDVCSDKLSRLLASNKLKATKGKSKKDGYVYEVI